MTAVKTRERGEKLRRFFFSVTPEGVGEGETPSDRNGRERRCNLIRSRSDFGSKRTTTTNANSIVIINELSNPKLRNDD